MIDYKKLKRGDFIMVSTCFGNRPAKFLGYTEAKSYLGNQPKYDVVHYKVIGESSKELEFLNKPCHDQYLRQFPHQNGLFGVYDSYYPREILSKLTKLEVENFKNKIQKLVDQFN